ARFWASCRRRCASLRVSVGRCRPMFAPPASVSEKVRRMLARQSTREGLHSVSFGLRRERHVERWAEQLKELRLSLKLSRQALAALAGVSPQTIKAYELGLRSPSQANLTAILDALRADRYLRNDILIGAGFAPDGGRLGPANDDYMFTLEEAREAIMGRPWPAHVNNELMEVLAANELMQRVWDVDLDREYNTPVERHMLTVAATPRFADRILNGKEMVSVGIAVMKGHHRGPERTPEGTSQYFQAVIQRLFEGDPHYRAEFEDAIRPRIRETLNVLDRAVRTTGLEMDDVSRILLVGGSSRIPLVAEEVSRHTGRPVAVDTHPKHAIALGAALIAWQRISDHAAE